MATIDAFVPSLHRLPRVAAVAVLCGLAAAATSGHVSAHNTVTFDEAGSAAPHIGLVGDSTLAGVRWAGRYGDLRQYNFVFDAESCRRTLERSCWSREDFRPDNTVLALQRLSGQLGDVVVVMSGYNDSSHLFDEAIDAVVAEAQDQAIPHVIWLTLRTADVSYQDPQERATSGGYREDNRVLYEKAEQLGGYLQIADWATHSEDRSDWFFGDGVHLTTDGVSALTTFIADSVDVVLAGGSLNPDGVPWTTLETGHTGDTVAEVQQALLDAGLTTVGVADGEYGQLTAQAVAEFQRARGLTITGTVDQPTATALGVHGDPPDAAPAPAPAVVQPAPGPTMISISVPVPGGDDQSSVVIGVALGAAVGAAALLARQRARRPQPDDPWEREQTVAPKLYDHELEDVLVS
jgi:peptidoglycan hydrolase-like protein with peptidoglycan-binding domain